MERPFDPAEIMPRAIIVMGVSGSGKTTLGKLAAARLGCSFLEGDSYHDAANVAKMRAGHPLDDADRWPWLDRLGAAIQAAVSADGVTVAACSALKRSYRERLCRAIDAPTSFVVLTSDREELARRVGNRPGHYMPASLLESQLKTLEMPGPDEPAIALDARATPEELWRTTADWLAGPSSRGKSCRAASR